MDAVVIAVGRVADWRTLERLNRDILIACAREAGAARYRVYRNAGDASRALIVAEGLDHEAMAELGRSIGEQLGGALAGGIWDDQIWEATTCDGFG